MDNDLISRSRLLKELEDTEINNRYSVEVLIYIQPTVEQPKGEWINTSPYDDKGECSLCCYLSKKHYNFCPNCGAKMKNE